MKKTKASLMAGYRLPIEGQRAASFSAPIVNRKSPIVNRAAFTLIELLVVISIMGVLAAMTMGVITQIKKVEYVNTAAAELSQIQTGLENYKNKYGFYPPSNTSLTPLVNTLYYELTGVTNNNGTYITIDGACSITQPNYKSAFTSPSGSSIDGIINCTKGSAEEGTVAQDFLPSLHANRLGTSSTTGLITNLVTSVRGPDTGYKPLGVQDLNPFRYIYPGTNNPSSYDLYVQLEYRGKTYLVCNWSKNAIINSPLP